MVDKKTAFSGKININFAEGNVYDVVRFVSDNHKYCL